MKLFAVLLDSDQEVHSIHSSEEGANNAIAHLRAVRGPDDDDSYVVVKEYILDHDPTPEEVMYEACFYVDRSTAISYRPYYGFTSAGDVHSLHNGAVSIMVMAKSMEDAERKAHEAYSEAIHAGRILTPEQYISIINERIEQEKVRQRTSAAISAAIATAPSE